MKHVVCPWWLGYLLVTPLRRLVQDPARILAPLVCEGMTVLEPGPGMGFFTLELARRVGPRGRVIAVDVQPRMLAALRRRAERAGLGSRIDTRQASEDSLNVDDLTGMVDLVVAFAMVHEIGDPGLLFGQLRRTLAPGGKVLLAEPSGHVRQPEFDATIAAAERAGFRSTAGPEIWRSRTAILE